MSLLQVVEDDAAEERTVDTAAGEVGAQRSSAHVLRPRRNGVL